MKKLLFTSLILCGLLGFSASAKTIMSGDCSDNPDEFININGALGDQVNITEDAGFFGFDNNIIYVESPVDAHGNAPQLFAIQANSACLKNEGYKSVKIAMIGMTTDAYGAKPVLYCATKTGIKPQTINLNVTWDTVNKIYTCR